jgi:hypothetical protein
MKFCLKSLKNLKFFYISKPRSRMVNSSCNYRDSVSDSSLDKYRGRRKVVRRARRLSSNQKFVKKTRYESEIWALQICFPLILKVEQKKDLITCRTSGGHAGYREWDLHAIETPLGPRKPSAWEDHGAKICSIRPWMLSVVSEEPNRGWFQ